MASRLTELSGDEVLFLHDRRIPNSRANIDHLAIGPAGVFVIDAKRYQDKRVEIRRSGGLFLPITEQLFVGGRDRTKLVAGLAPQVAAVYCALADSPDTAALKVQAMLCFVDALLPVFGSLTMAGVPIVGPKGASKLVRAEGPLDAAARLRVQMLLAGRLPAIHT